MRRGLWKLLPCLLIVAAPTPVHAQNLLVNPNFDGAPTSWDQLWSRDPGSATDSVDTDHPPSMPDTARSIKVVSTGDRDWSIGQSTPFKVGAGDILTLSGWLKGDGDGTAQISLHTGDSSGGTVDWMAGLVEGGGTHDWQKLSRRYVVPAGVSTVQYRLTGDGHETCWLAGPSLTRSGNISALAGVWHGRVFALSNGGLTVRFNPSRSTLALVDDHGKAWWQSAGTGAIVKSAKQVSTRELRCSVWNVENDFTTDIDLKLDPKLPQVSITIGGDGDLPSPLTFPSAFQTATGESLVVPLNEGILYPVDDPGVETFRMPTYMGNSTSMPWTGLIDSAGAGVMTVVDTPDDADFDIVRDSKSLLTVQPLWEASRGRLAYARRLTYVVFDKGGYVAQAKWYRAYARHIGLFKSLAEKRQANPNVDKLIGAANIWNWDMDKVVLCDEMKSLGLDRVLWSNAGSPDQVAAINKLGYLTSRYDIYQDVWPADAPGDLHKEGWPDDLVLLKNGDWMKGWADIRANSDGTKTTYQGGVINSARGLARAKREIPEDLKSTPYECRFLDTTTASPWREDYSPVHPLTRSQDRANKMALLAFCSVDMKLVTGSETGIDTAVPYVDYFEGMMSLSKYRLEDAGRNMLPPEPATPDILKFMVGPKYRIPLWELVYHDCVVSYWYWGDYNNKIPEVWPQRDLFDILYAVPPMYMFDRSTWERDKSKFVTSYKGICPLARRFGYDEMLSHAFLTEDHTLQETRWRSGARIVVNFGDAAQTVDGVSIPAFGYKVLDGRATR